MNKKQHLKKPNREYIDLLKFTTTNGTLTSITIMPNNITYNLPSSVIVDSEDGGPTAINNI